MIRYLVLLGTLLGPSMAESYMSVNCTAGEEDIYQFNATLLDGSATVDFGDYRGKQEPGNSYEEIVNGVKYVRPGGGFVPNLTYFEKIDVNGDNEHPIYTFLKAYCPYTDSVFEVSENLFYSPQRVSDVRWNWEKFLITKEGKPYKRYNANTMDPAYLEDDIAYLLSQ
ncbi:hypothetical protein Anas_06159 [Armadillidium nasatum]|uniref:Glutathione peroxidase n=1 Tax=Armadillidium nasatum TaxID=96803 RepID=A0A5N5SU29_9CRUS|nr:hypothetical protein Anas_06159 [Armadillidium nasatum]